MGLFLTLELNRKCSGDGGWPEADSVFWRKAKSTVVC